MLTNAILGVGHKLLDELFTLPVGLDPELEKAIEEFTEKKKERNAKMKDLSDKAAVGGVKGLAAKNELEQMAAGDKTELNRLEVTLEAAKKKASKSNGEAALLQKKKVVSKLNKLIQKVRKLIKFKISTFHLWLFVTVNLLIDIHKFIGRTRS